MAREGGAVGVFASFKIAQSFWFFKRLRDDSMGDLRVNTGLARWMMWVFRGKIGIRGIEGLWERDFLTANFRIRSRIIHSLHNGNT